MAHGLLQGQTQQQYYNSNNYGGYQFISLADVIDNFMATYTGEDKILEKINRPDVSFHAHRALAELSFDVFKSCKAQEIEIPASLAMVLPQDYVNYIKLTWSDSSGIEHVIYPARKTSNPTPILQNSDGDYVLEAIGTLNNTATVVLDSEYSNILTGMVVTAPNVPFGTTVRDITTTANITTITLWDGTNNVNATYIGTETLRFWNPGGDLVLQEESSVILLGCTWAASSNKITVASTADADSIEVGMVISDGEFTTGTTVTDINGVIVTVSAPSAALGAATSLTFISNTIISDTWSKYKGASSANQDDYMDNTYWSAGVERYGLDPQYAQANGSFFIDDCKGMIYFGSNLVGKTVILKYISDSLGTDAEMQVHKLAEEAMYKWIMYGCLSAKINVPEYVVRRYKKEKFAETRKAKIRLSNIKLEEISQILRGKSKQIKH